MGALINAQKLVGLDKANVLRVPYGDRTMDAEGWAAVDRAIGVPENPDGYGQFQPPTGNLTLQAEQVTAFDARMHAAGASSAARNAALEAYHEMSAESEQRHEEAYSTEVTQGMAALKQEHGANLDPLVKAGEAAALAVLGQGYIDFIKSCRIDDHPQVMGAYIKLAQAVQEDGLTLPGGGAPTSETPQQAKAKIAELQKDPAYMNANDVNHVRVINEIQRLFEVAYPAG